MATTLQDKAIVSTQLPRPVYDELARRALDTDRSLSAEVRRIIVRHLDDETEEEAT